MLTKVQFVESKLSLVGNDLDVKFLDADSRMFETARGHELCCSRSSYLVYPVHLLKSSAVFCFQNNSW